MSTLNVIIDSNPVAAEPSYSISDCGFVKATLPESFSDDDIISTVSKHLGENEESLTKESKKAIKKYREKWTDLANKVVGEFGYGDIPLLFGPNIRIAKTDELICVSQKTQGLCSEITCTFDPLCSLLSDESVELMLRPRLARSGYDLYYNVSGSFRTTRICGDDVQVEYSENENADYFIGRRLEMADICNNAIDAFKASSRFKDDYNIMRNIRMMIYRSRK